MMQGPCIFDCLIVGQRNHISTHLLLLMYNYSSTIYFQIEIVHMCFSNMCFCFTLSMCIQSQLLHAAFIVEQYFTRVTLMSLSFECASLLLFSTTSHNTFWLEAICVKLRFSKVALSHFSAAAPTLGSELHGSPLKALLNWTWLHLSCFFLLNSPRLNSSDCSLSPSPPIRLRWWEMSCIVGAKVSQTL